MRTEAPARFNDLIKYSLCISVCLLDIPALYTLWLQNENRENKFDFALPGYTGLRSGRGCPEANSPSYKDTTPLVLQRTLPYGRAFRPIRHWPIQPGLSRGASKNWIASNGLRKRLTSIAAILAGEQKRGFGFSSFLKTPHIFDSPDCRVLPRSSL